MAVPEISNFFSNINWSSLVSKIIITVTLLLVVVVGGMIMAGFFYWKKRRKSFNQAKHQVIWWAEGKDGNSTIRDRSWVEEVNVPGTSLRLFYEPAKDRWLPRFNIEVDKGLYYVARTKYGEIINFAPGSINKQLQESNLLFDHTDVRWESENMREYIKNHFANKGQKWWQAYQGLITNMSMIMVFTFCFIMIIFFMRGIIDDIGSVASTLSAQVENLCAVPGNAALVPALIGIIRRKNEH